MTSSFRIERDSMGELQVPADALWGAQTQRAVENFPISGLTLPRGFIRALALVKQAAARANTALGLLDPHRLAGDRRVPPRRWPTAQHDAHFPIDVFQTGSGTSTNMNANEVIAALASAAARQPGASQRSRQHGPEQQRRRSPRRSIVSAALAVQQRPAAGARAAARGACGQGAEVGRHREDRAHAPDGRHAGDAGAGAVRLAHADRERHRARAARASRACTQLAQGGTAVGTGINAHPQFGQRFCAELSRAHGDGSSRPARNYFEAMSAQDTAVELSGQLKVLAVSLMKIANDLRWMNSGPLAGLGEIALPALQPGSSIMPGKVNPVIPEATAMVAAQVIGNDATITIAGQSGNFQLNVMLPLIAYNLLQSIATCWQRRARAGRQGDSRLHGESGAARRGAGPQPHPGHRPEPGDRLREGRRHRQEGLCGRAAHPGSGQQMTDLPREELKKLLDPAELTRGGIKGGTSGGG